RARGWVAEQGGRGGRAREEGKGLGTAPVAPRLPEAAEERVGRGGERHGAKDGTARGTSLGEPAAGRGRPARDNPRRRSGRQSRSRLQQLLPGGGQWFCPVALGPASLRLLSRALTRVENW